MNNRRTTWISIILLLFVFSLFAKPLRSLQAQNPAIDTLELAQQDDTFKIALVLDTGSELLDGGYNESTWSALQRAESELGAEIAFYQAPDPEETVETLFELAAGDTDLIFTVGFQLAAPTAEVALQYPNKHFIGVDQFQIETIDNYTGLIFPEDQGGFLAGVLAASLTQTGIVAGVYGSPDVPPVVAFREGYEAGVRWYNEQFGTSVIVVGEYHPGTVLDAFADPSWGASIAASFLEEDADVVFAAAGATGVGALEEVAFAAEDEDQPIYCIGVDTDQWLTVPEAHPCLVSSATKQIAEGVYTLILNYLNGDIEGGNFVGTVGLAPFHDFEDELDADTKTLLKQVERGLQTNAILTCYNLDLSGIRIGMVMDIDQRIDDGSFNESVWNGMRAAEFCGAEIDFVETQSTSDYATNITEFAENGYNIIVTVGFALAEDTNAAALAYPDILFVGVDQFQTEVTPGVVGMVFHEDQAGFLAGVLAANLTESNIVAAVLGSDIIPPVVAFKDGFEAGVRYVDPDIRVISTFHPGGVDIAFSDPQWGAATARQALDQGADVVFAAAGLTGNGALIEVASVGTNPPYCIGVDTDQWLTVPEAHPCLVSSAVKLLDGAMASIVVDYVNGTLESGNYFGEVGLAPFHDFEDSISEELKAELATLAQQLRDGTLQVSDYYQ
ncbi:MAG: hypothetical protein CUN55_14050 [Phototrophicales bacterium]|nr:MAG: hypothetical protein CUN55_14050 [Phototrophicales bacterium]